tara:strand:+ start:288 stop:725 length:438 start_codon:yes stop_codon:yes gene_type:complete
MKFLKSLLKNKQELYLTLVLVIYILFNFKTPELLTNLIDTTIGKVVIFLLTITLILRNNPVIAVLSIIAAYELIKRSNRINQIFMNDNIPSERTKLLKLKELNNFPTTLEEEIVENMPPLVKFDLPSNTTFKPILNNIHNADSSY